MDQNNNIISERVKWPIRTSATLGLLFLILTLCLIIGVLTYLGYYQTAQGEYRKDLSETIHFIQKEIDIDDLERCVQTGEMSEKYAELQDLMDSVVDTMGILYIYVFIPLNETGTDSAQTIIASNTAEEYAAGNVVPVLNALSGTDCPEEVAIENMKAYLSDEVSFFRTDSVWGSQYTGALPLFNSNGERFALLCADVNIDDIHHRAMQGVFAIVVPLLILGFLFWVVTARLVDKNITLPLTQLQERTREFAATCDRKNAPESLVFDRPDIHTKNEVESLSYAIEHMAHSIHNYAEEIRTAEDQTLEMTLLAYRDSLTHVKNATAYEEEQRRLEREIEDGHTEFALVIVDANNLKDINDKYGHEYGDEYIIGVCRILCDVYHHSTVFRTGGDEFVAVLQNRNYHSRNELLLTLRQTFAQTAMDETLSPWCRYSAAAGMAIYQQGDTVKDVFHRADKAMYQSKILMKERCGLPDEQG